jgi:hypothetical protein
MAPLGFIRSPRAGRYFRGFAQRRVFKLRDGAQYLAAMTQDAEILEVLVRQVADNREVNAVLDEAPRVL